MPSLLTLNGIPPQIVGSLDESQQQLIIHYTGQDNKRERYDLWHEAAAEVVQPFTTITSKIINAFTGWGATAHEQYHHVTLLSSKLGKGATNFQGDLNLHSDDVRALEKLQQEALLTLRFLCVSHTPRSFIDLTDCNDMAIILANHSLDKGGRIYKKKLLAQGPLVVPRPWEIIAFDTATPHLPEGVSEPGMRILISEWRQNFRLPPRWQERLKHGDAPTL